MTDNCLHFVLKYPHECCAAVSRKGESEPCNKTAVAVAAGEDDGGPMWWPVCAYHARGRDMVSLAELIDTVAR